MGPESCFDFVKLPKTDLHVHLEGTLEPEMLFRLAGRNHIPLPWKSPAMLREACRFRDLAGFLAIYYKGCEVLVTEQDFYDLARAYLERAAADGVVHTEFYFNPQLFCRESTPLAAIMRAIFCAMDEMRDRISSFYMGTVMRTRPVEEALRALDELAPWYDRIVAFGMGGAENGNPPSRFQRYFDACRERGFRTCVHAGEEGPAAYVREAVALGIDRIDHGNAAIQDPELVRLLAERRIPLTMCPISNLRLNVVNELSGHPLKRMLSRGVCVTVNSDDPAYFLGYASDNWAAVHRALDLSGAELRQLALNGVEASFLPEARKAVLREKIKRVLPSA
ncbi:adenosine deaminase [uncultured Victivallis sp.]|uniref:adenosine deaminase n=1 Tax=uncultured Victivallis sp. TaxID=354118 RepID=UPI0025D09632|nr:adenosine deaminase [uncultured Victivallis sp.]